MLNDTDDLKYSLNGKFTTYITTMYSDRNTYNKESNLSNHEFKLQHHSHILPNLERHPFDSRSNTIKREETLIQMLSKKDEEIKVLNQKLKEKEREHEQGQAKIEKMDREIEKLKSELQEQTLRTTCEKLTVLAEIHRKEGNFERSTDIYRVIYRVSNSKAESLLSKVSTLEKFYRNEFDGFHN